MLCRFFSVVLATVLALTLDAAVKLSALVFGHRTFYLLESQLVSSDFANKSREKEGFVQKL